MAKMWKNGIMIEVPDPTPEEIAQMQAEVERLEREYWQTVPYKDAVIAKIRERYSADDEFAISRQRDSKPEEFEEYYNYCEECKAFVKAKKSIGGDAE